MSAPGGLIAARGLPSSPRWQLRRIGDLVQLHYGRALPAPKRRPGPIPVFGSNGPCGWHDTPLAAGPTVVLGRKGQGPLGVEWSQDSFWVIDTAYYARVDSGALLLRYFYYLAKYVGLNHLKDGTSNPSLSRDTFYRQAFPIPPVRRQEEIVELLSAYDALIENCERRIRVLDEIARALYNEWFVSFRYPGHETVSLEQSALGPLPRGWRARALGEILRIYRGRSYRSTDLADEGGVPFVNLKCMDRDGGFRRSGLKRFVGSTPESHAVRKGDLVIAVTDMTQERRIVARTALIPTLESEFGVLSMDLVRLEALDPWPTAWLYAYLRYSDFADHLKQHANGANVLHLSPDRVRDHVIGAPPLQLAGVFADQLTPMIEAGDSLMNRIEVLAKTRDLLLPRLLSGQLQATSAA